MRRLALPALVLALALVLAACGDEAPSRSGYVARVDDEYLTEAEIAEALRVVPTGLDSSTARQQVIDQWVKGRLLAQEARRQGLPERDDVRRQLADNERAVLAAALIDRFFESNAAEPTDEEIAAYFEANQDRLTLREPYARVRIIATATEAQANQARSALVRAAETAFADSLSALAVRTYSTDPEGALSLAQTYLPESRIAGLEPAVAQLTRTLGPGEVGPVTEVHGRYVVVQVVDRVPAGSAPRLAWVREELRQRLAIEARNTMLSRQVQQLKTEAQATGRLEVR